jgi:hypothetical protein
LAIATTAAADALALFALALLATVLPAFTGMALPLLLVATMPTAATATTDAADTAAHLSFLPISHSPPVMGPARELASGRRGSRSGSL